MYRIAIFSILVCLSACTGYVRQEQFDDTISDLRATDAELADEISSFRNQFTELTRDLNNRFESYDATIANFQGRLQVEMNTHFDFDDDTVKEVFKPALKRFSEVVTMYHPRVVVTVEGFTDPSGNAEYNKALGLRRAEAVRAYLLENGVHEDYVRAVSFGEESRRLLKPGAVGKEGAENRRVSLVVDYLGQMPQMN